METYQQRSIFNSLIAIVSQNQTLAKILKEQCGLYGFNHVSLLSDWPALIESVAESLPDLIVSDHLPEINNAQSYQTLRVRTDGETLPVILYGMKYSETIHYVPEGVDIVASLYGREEEQRLLELIHEELRKNILEPEQFPGKVVQEHFNILVATADQELGAVIQLALKQEGYFVSLVSEGHEAMRYIDGISPHLVLLEANLPGFSGASLLSWIKESFPETHVVMMGTDVGEQQINRFLAAGAERYLSKPFSIDHLLTLCRSILSQSNQIAVHERLLQRLEEKEQQIQELLLLKESEETLRTLVTASGDIIFRITPQGVINFATPAVEEQLGYTPEDIEQEHINVSKFVHSNDLIRVMAGIRQVIRGSSIQGLECRLMHQDRVRFRWYSINCYPMYNSQKTFVGVGGIARDIGSIKRYEEEIQQQNERLAALNAIAGIVSHSLNPDDTLSGVIDKVLEIMRLQAGGIFLIDRETNEATLKSSRTLSEKRIGFESALQEACFTCVDIKEQLMKTHEPVVIKEMARHPHLAKTALASLGWQGLIGLPLVSMDIVYGIMALLTEDTRQFSRDDLQFLASIGHQVGISLENMALYQQELKARERLEDLNRLKDDFVAIVSHDLRSPLTAILGATEILLNDDYMDVPLTTDQRELIENIQVMGEQQLHLVNDLLDLAKIESGKIQLTPTVADIEDVALQCLQTLQVLADNKDIRLAPMIAPGLPKIRIDVPKVTQVINNLLSNAIKFTEPGGSITLQVEKDEEMIKVAVSDTGEGIPPEELLLLFNKFQQVKSSGTRGERGTGLGLAICKNLIELHHGKIWVESRIGMGSTFAFTLPVTEHVILIIDDSIFVARSLEAILMEHIDHITVKYAQDGNEGLQMVEEFAPVVIILDYMMPEEDGIQVFQKLRKRYGSKVPPTIFLTASQDLEVRRQIFDLGAADYLQKPVDVNDLLPRISRFL
ncbi:putative two-component hybrid sensor and regulator [Candidatus Moduliflexus flocculans]|uniref:histidine kinase n=1 Tax=Candidatus Moduliflexus flocculans TaxID=1499966 RepID=A0A081BLH2_9BACT|nr:putative two-component hybrid sensor and regulator [Candidatus Moduliflexus flocculans]